jgi:hypothetical protein
MGNAHHKHIEGSSNSGTRKDTTTPHPSQIILDLNRHSFWKCGDPPIKSPSSAFTQSHSKSRRSSQYEELPGVHTPSSGSSVAVSSPRHTIGFRTGSQRSSTNSFHSYRYDDVLLELGPEISSLATLENSDNPIEAGVSVLEGSSWVFNPSPPINKTLRQRLQSYYPDGLRGYTNFINSLNKVRLSTFVGIPQVETDLLCLKMLKSVSLKQAEIDAIVLQENIQMPKGLSWEVSLNTEEDATEKTVLFLVFDSAEFYRSLTNDTEEVSPIGADANNWRHSHIQQLETLLHGGMISQIDFSKKKAQFLKEWNSVCHATFVNYSSDSEITAVVI